VEDLNLPSYMEVIIEPWPYGSLEVGDEPGRYFQGLVYARDTRNGNNPDSNFYSHPIPIIPVVDYYKRELVRIERLATGGKGDPLKAAPRDSSKHPLAHCTTAEYIPELIEGGVRKDLKELDVVQPDGPSFTVSDGSLVEWQKWRFRVSFTAREGVVIHDVHYGGRSVFHRLSISEMVRI
jgi:primary-amine oxidase